MSTHTILGGKSPRRLFSQNPGTGGRKSTRGCSGLQRLPCRTAPSTHFSVHKGPGPSIEACVSTEQSIINDPAQLTRGPSDPTELRQRVTLDLCDPRKRNVPNGVIEQHQYPWHCVLEPKYRPRELFINHPPMEHRNSRVEPQELSVEVRPRLPITTSVLSRDLYARLARRVPSFKLAVYLPKQSSV